MQFFSSSRLSSLVTATFFVSITACSTVGKNHVSSLKNTENLKRDAKDKRALVWRSPEKVSARSAFNLAEIQWLAPNPEIKPAERAVLTKRLTTALTKQFGSKGQMNGAGPAQVEIRGAITGVVKANVPLNILASAVINFPVIMGGVAVDLEAVSQPGDKRIAAGQYVIPGRPWQMLNSLTKLGQARSGLDLVAGKFYTLVTGEKAVVDESKKLKMNPLKR